MDVIELKKIANEVRKGIVTSVHSAKAGHPGGSLSAADIFTYLYFEEMNIDPKNPKMENRDRFVLSKGHTAPGLYSALANRGYFPVEDLVTLRHTGSYLQGHPDMKARLLPSGTSLHAAYSRSGHVQRFPGSGNFCSSGHGLSRQNGSEGLPGIYPFRRRRDPGGTGMGGFHVCGTQKAGQPGSHCGQ